MSTTTDRMTELTALNEAAATTLFDRIVRARNGDPCYFDEAVKLGISRAVQQLGLGRWYHPEPCDDAAHGQAAVCGSCGATAGEEQGR